MPVLGSERPAVDQELAAFEEARQRALSYLDHPVTLDGGMDRDDLYQERGGAGGE